MTTEARPPWELAAKLIAYTGVERHVDNTPLAPLAPALRAYVVLRWLGEPGPLREAARRAQTIADLDTAAKDKLAAHAELAAAAEAALAEFGGTFDPDGMDVSFAVGKRGHPPTLLSLAAGLILDEAEPAYRRETGDRQDMPQELRERVASRLSLFFPPDLLETGRNGRLDSALRRWLKYRERYLSLVDRIAAAGDDPGNAI